MIVTKKGYGKRTFVQEFRETRRGSKGVKALNITEKNGGIASFNIIDDKKDIVIITDSGMVIRLDSTTISQLGRNAQGVRLINLKDNQIVSSISIVEKIIEETENGKNLTVDNLMADNNESAVENSEKEIQENSVENEQE